MLMFDIGVAGAGYTNYDWTYLGLYSISSMSRRSCGVFDLICMDQGCFFLLALLPLPLLYYAIL